MTAISRRVLSICLAAGWLCSLAAAQSVNSSLNFQPSQASAVVPRLVNYSGKAIDAEVKIISGTAGATFAIYSEQSGGAPLWMETQNVTADAKGNYTVQLGATQPEGLPLDVFASGEARWLGVRINGEEEQPRVLLLSVPYALKAADSQTLGGLPASAFMLAGASNESASTVSHASAKTSSTINPSVSGTGKTDYIPLWTNTTGGLGDSVLFQSGTKIGINTIKPATALDVTGRVNSSLGFDLGGEPFAFGSYANQNVFLGFAGNTTLSEGFNTGVGWGALLTNTTGNSNTATGYGALGANATGNANTANGSGALGSNTAGAANTANGGAALGSNTTGGFNTAAGAFALRANTTGNFNTAVGSNAEVATGSLSNATAIGANAEVSESNALVLGSINGVNNATASTNVGIGTTSPSHQLEVNVGAATVAQTAVISTGSDAALSLINTGSGGREYWIDSGSNGAGIGSGNFAIWDSTAHSARLTIDSAGNASQQPTAGGFVKAMLYVNAFSAPYTILRCFNSTLTGAAATTPPCGVRFNEEELGIWNFTFNFEVDNRFASATLDYTVTATGSPSESSSLIRLGYGVFSGPDSLAVYTTTNGATGLSFNGQNAFFTLVVF